MRRLPSSRRSPTVEARVLGLSDADAAAAARVAAKVLGHDLIARARAAERRGACRRETPVTCRMPDGRVVEGIVDLAFEEGGAWVVVDYKSDRVLAADGEERYRRQIGFYVSAIRAGDGVARFRRACPRFSSAAPIRLRQWSGRWHGIRWIEVRNGDRGYGEF